MKRLGWFLLMGLMLNSCRKPEEVTVTETRPLTTRDEGLEVDASARDQFEEPTAIVAEMMPPGWERLPGTQFRILNYRFGDGGEVSVGISQGGLRENVNRWRGQYGAKPLGEAEVAGLEKVPVIGGTGVLVVVEGDFGGGMGMPAKKGQGLAGIISDRGGQIVTVKMTGNAEEVRTQTQALKEFAISLRPR